MSRNRVRRDEDETKGVMLKFLYETMEMHPDLWNFTQQVRNYNKDSVVIDVCVSS